MLLTALALAGFSGCSEKTAISSGDLQLEFDGNMNSRVVNLAGKDQPLQTLPAPSDFLVTRHFTADKFPVVETVMHPVSDSIGTGTELMITGVYSVDDISLLKIVRVVAYDSLPGSLVCSVKYVNNGLEDLLVKGWVNSNYLLQPEDTSTTFWSFQGSSTSSRADWVLPLTPGFSQENFMGMNDSDYGGGIPVTDVWRRDAGLAIGSLSMVPAEISLPVFYDRYRKDLSVSVKKTFGEELNLACGDTLYTVPVLLTLHHGDYFAGLRRYSEVMQKRGIRFPVPEEEAFEPIWCGWGYMRSFTKKEILGTLPKVKEMGIKWAVIDDGYQIAEGDWNVDTKRFPGGNREMKELVAAIHAAGLKAKLWWAPLAADPGSRILKEDPKVLLINKTGSPQYITWWDSYYLSPAYQGTIDYTRNTVKMFMQDWGFDGLKLDGQHMNAVPPDYNWERPLESPLESVEKLPSFYESIYNEARSIKPHAVVENCPCGCCMSFYNMPFTNQFVASDPTSSWQIRLKGKTYRALMPHAAYYGDHVELSDGGDDFASSFGIGAVLGTKFTWPADNPAVKESYLLTPEKEKTWKKWFGLYNDMMLSKGEYLGGLYDIGFDRPETHVIGRGDTLYYAFYAGQWDGKITFRGLQAGTSYRVYDYVSEKELGEVSAEKPEAVMQFSDHLLLELTPLEKIK
ncbi:MAG: glycoside hydrolase family 36 protein [Bacteroidota bacterium]